MQVQCVTQRDADVTRLKCAEREEHSRAVRVNNVDMHRVRRVWRLFRMLRARPSSSKTKLRVHVITVVNLCLDPHRDTTDEKNAKYLDLSTVKMRADQK